MQPISHLTKLGNGSENIPAQTLDDALERFEQAFEVASDDLAQFVENIPSNNLSDYENNDFLVAALLDLHLTFQRAIRALRHALAAGCQTGGDADAH